LVTGVQRLTGICSQRQAKGLQRFALANQGRVALRIGVHFGRGPLVRLGHGFRLSRQS